MNLQICSSLPTSFRDQLESLFYFNDKQAGVAEQIMHVIEQYGQPVVHEQDGKIWLDIEGRDCQCLFFLGDELLAGCIYLRPNIDELEFIHLCVKNSDICLLNTVLDEWRKLASRINGIERIRFPYSKKAAVKIIH